jgi:hypothetical protein
MEDINLIIKKIQDGNCTENQIVEYLGINNLFVLSNAMFEIVKKGYHSPEIIICLERCSQFRDPQKHKLFGIDTIGLLAIATLIKIGIAKEDIYAYNELDDLCEARVDILVNEAFN